MIKGDRRQRLLKILELISTHAIHSQGTVTASFTIESFGLSRLMKINCSDIEKRLAEFKAAARVG